MGKKKRAKSRKTPARPRDDDLHGIVDQMLLTAGGDEPAAILGLIRAQHEAAPEVATRVSVGYVYRRALK